MAIRNVSTRNVLANAYAADNPYGSLHTADPGTADAATGEVTGGSPAYARKAMTWGSASAGAVVSAATPFDVPSGTTVTYFAVASTTTGATIGDSASVTSQAFASQGVYTVTATYTQS